MACTREFLINLLDIVVARRDLLTMGFQVIGHISRALRGACANRTIEISFRRFGCVWALLCKRPGNVTKRLASFHPWDGWVCTSVQIRHKTIYFVVQTWLKSEVCLACLSVLSLYKNNLDLPFSSPKCTALSDCLYPNNNMELNYVIVSSTLGLHQLSVQNWVG